MISLDEALALLLDGVELVGCETVALAELDTRVLARPVVASHDQPAEPRSVMDGIALARIDALDYRVVGESRAGAPFAAALQPGEAVAISTGAVLPAGADQVVPKETVTCDGVIATVSEWPSSPFIRPSGSDFHEGERLLEPGRALDPAAIALIAAANRADAVVATRPRVAIVATGDELVQPGSTLGPGESVDSVSYGLAALVARWGGVATRLPVVADDLDGTVVALQAALENFDVVATIGGASVGEHDHLRPAAKRLGAKVRFERINVQPGKPSWHARTRDGGMLLGIPGNPSSAFVCAHLLLRPLLMTMTGRRSAARHRAATLDRSIPPNGSREQFVRALQIGDDGADLVLRPLGSQDSGLQFTLAKATHLIRQPADDRGCEAGTAVKAIPLETTVT